MAEISGKKKKAALPAGWDEKFTPKHPDRAYYFNENNGDKSWTPPVKELDKTMEKPKGKKRKMQDDEEEVQAADPPAVEVKNNNDTPAMRLYREKMAQRKAALEAKKSTPKSKVSLNQTVTPQKTNGTVSATPPSVQKRLTRRSIVPSTAADDSASSDGSVASMGAKIKQLTKAVEPERPKSPQFGRIRLPKIPKVKIVRAEIPASSGSVSDYGTMSDTNSLSLSNGKSDFGTPGSRSTSKTPANERLQKLRKSLGAEKEKPLPNKRSRRTLATDFNDNDSEMLEQSKLPPTLSVSRAKAQSRLSCLEKRVQRNSFVEMSRARQVRSDEEEEGEAAEDRRLREKHDGADAFCEQMDWEPIEDEKITSEVYTVRLQLCEKPAETLSELSNHVINSGHVANQINALYVVVDTNVFLSNLPFVEEVRDSQSKQFGRPFIVVPWTVLQELDYIKDDKDNSRSNALKLCARKAVDFLNRHFSAKHPRFLGQTPTEVERNKQRFEIECPDDEILQTCLQIKDSTRSVVLLSYDKNLCTKAMVHDISTIGRDVPWEKIEYLKAAETTDFLSNSLHSRIKERAEDVSLMQKEMLEADDIMEEAKAHLQSILSAIIKKEMQKLFNDRWELHVLYKPPWTIETVLKNVLKHWMGTVSVVFTNRRSAESMIRDVQDQIRNAPEGGRKLADVRQFVEKCIDIVSTVDSAKYPEVKLQVLDGLEGLKQRCTGVTGELESERFKLNVGTEPDAEEAERRAFRAFKLFEELYDYSRDVCGMASDALGLQCSIQYNKFNQRLTSRIALDQEKMIGVNVNKLAQALDASLIRMNERAQPNDRTIHALYEVITNFAADLNHDASALAPLDLFCCLKNRRAPIVKGVDQLHELCVHFARIANYQCTS